VLLSAFIPGALILAIVAIIALVAYEQVARRMVEQRDADSRGSPPPDCARI
jgi:hypothetical protein